MPSRCLTKEKRYDTIIKYKTVGDQFMNKSAKRSIAILLSLLMMLSVFGGLTLTAGAEDTTEGHDIINQSDQLLL